MLDTAPGAPRFLICSALAAVLLAVQLPPDVQTDRLWLRAERQIGPHQPPIKWDTFSCNKWDIFGCH